MGPLNESMKEEMLKQQGDIKFDIPLDHSFPNISNTL